jgi:hypothetical protein
MLSKGREQDLQGGGASAVGDDDQDALITKIFDIDNFAQPLWHRSQWNRGTLVDHGPDHAGAVEKQTRD